MSVGKTLGPTAAASATAVAALPVTGDSTVSVVLVGIGCLASGLLLLRAGRQRRNRA
jgi:LPXTG-motif cell wall-anchored protein